MATVPWASFLWAAICLPSLCLGASWNRDSQHRSHFAYSRLTEVRRKCSFILSSSLLKLEGSKVSDIAQIKYFNGEWAQDSNASLLPLRMGSENSSFWRIPYLLRSSFAVTDVDLDADSPKVVNMRGSLSLSIEDYERGGWRDLPATHTYTVQEGSSWLDIDFQGVYVESEEAGGESVMCLLGSTNRPFRDNNHKAPWSWTKFSQSGENQITLSKDDDILLILRHPKSFSLTRRVIEGEMTSLRNKSALEYFAKVPIIFKAGPLSTTYKFQAGDIIAKACNPYPHPDKLGSSLKPYKEGHFCSMLDSFASRPGVGITLKWMCDSSSDHCTKMEQYLSKDINITRGSTGHVSSVMMADLRCEMIPGPNGGNVSATVAFFLQDTSPWSSRYPFTSLSCPIFSAEGMWNSSSGQLCMLACACSHPSSCETRICLYVLTSFSLSQRRILVGSVSSIGDRGNLSTFAEVLGPVIGAYGGLLELNESVLSYSYSSTKQAREYLQRGGGDLKYTLFKYPRMKEGVYPCDDLQLSAAAVPLHGSANKSQKKYVQFNILHLGSKFCSNQQSTNYSSSLLQASASSGSDPPLVNVAGELIISGNHLNVEGVYSQPTGEMRLVGCNVTDTLDCEIVVNIQYPPTTLQWLITPSATLSIKSSRSEDDPLHFETIELQTMALMYRSQSEEVLSERRVEAILRVFTLSIAICCIVRQLFYVKVDGNAGPYVSHVMLGILATGFGLPLIIGEEALFARLNRTRYEPYVDNSTIQMDKFLIRLLALAAFFLTLWLWHKSWESRVRLASRAPREKRVFWACFFLHAVAFLVTLLIETNVDKARSMLPYFTGYSSGRSLQIQKWGAKLAQYAGLMQDLFLIPQVIGNIVWQIKSRPLRKAYYIGITIVRLLPHAYDYIRVRPMSDYVYTYDEFLNPDLGFYSKTGDAVLVILSALLVVVVYLQQRRSSQRRDANQMPGSYGRVASEPFSLELAAGAVEAEEHANVQI